MDNDDTITLFRALDDDSFLPPTVDVDTAMRNGRKRLLRRRLVATGAGIAAAATIIAAAPIAVHAIRGPVPASEVGGPHFTAPASLTCTEAALPVPQPGLISVTDAADPTGRYVVGNVGKSDDQSLQGINGSREVVIWHDGKIATTFTPPGGDEIGIEAINSHGVMVGGGVPVSTAGTTTTAQSRHFPDRPRRKRRPSTTTAKSSATNMTARR